MKKGRLSLIEQDYIKMNCKRLSYTELATHLNRDVASIRIYVEKKLGMNLTTKTDFEEKAEFDVKRRPYWKEISRQFSEGELEMFAYQWARIIAQFQQNLLPTEEMQLVNVVKLDIMSNRILEQQHQIKDSINTLESTLNLEKDAAVEDRNHAFILDLERQIAVLRTAQDDSSKEFRELISKQGAILRDMKATRDQRLKKVESSKENFATWMGEIINNPEKRKELGIRMEKMRLAMENERKRLSEFHVYVDGSVDRPILSSDTVTEEDTKGNE